MSDDYTAIIYPKAVICARTKRTLGMFTTIGDFSFICCKELVMEEGSMIARFVEVSGRGKVTLKTGAVVASHASLLTSSDQVDAKMNDASPEDERDILTDDINIGKFAYIGQHATIMPGVKIGDWAVVGAYSYIDKNVPAHTIVHPRQELVSRVRVLNDKMTTKMKEWKEDSI